MVVKRTKEGAEAKLSYSTVSIAAVKPNLQETLSLLDIVNDFSHGWELKCLSFPNVSWLA